MIKHVLFDLDGTIVDTNELIIESFLHVLNVHVSLIISREEIIPQMGLPLADQFRYFSGRPVVDDLVAAYRVYNASRHDELVKVFPNVIEVVNALVQAGFGLGVVTTKMRASSERVLGMYGLLEHMQTVITLDDVEQPKPHPEPVLKAIEQLGAQPHETLMIGDSPIDIQSAQRAGARSAAVAWSLKGPKVLQTYNPDWMLYDMRDLYPIVGLKEGSM
jgi:pyrophosphatase PpaX